MVLVVSVQGQTLWLKNLTWAGYPSNHSLTLPKFNADSTDGLLFPNIFELVVLITPCHP